MRPLRLELLRNADKRERRLVLELLAVALVGFVLFHVSVAPALRSFVPEVFGRAIVENGRRPPETALGWMRGAVLVAAMGGHFYYRLYRTALGEELQEKYLGLYGQESR